MRGLLIPAAALLLTACATATGPDAANRFDSYRTVQSQDLQSFERVQVLMPTAGPDVAKRIDARRRLNSRERPLSQRDVDEKLARLHGDLVRAIGRNHQITSQGGEGVLTVRTILTDLNANRPTQADLADNPGLSFQSIATGDAAVTIEFLEDGQVLAVVKDRDNVTNLNDPRAQPAGIWSTADRFFDRVAEKVSALLS